MHASILAKSMLKDARDERQRVATAEKLIPMFEAVGAALRCRSYAPSEADWSSGGCWCALAECAHWLPWAVAERTRLACMVVRPRSPAPLRCPLTRRAAAVCFGFDGRR
jgi:hypothetical protein